MENKHIIYTAEDIERYLSGDMSHDEMYAMEKAALDDPFLAEAIEGYEAMKQKDWSIELAALKQKLEDVENAPIVPLYKSSFIKWWKAAAAVLLIGSSALIAYLFTGKPITENAAVAKVERAADSSAAAKTDTATNNSQGAVQAGIALNKNSSTASGTALYADTTKQVLLADAAVEKKQNDFVYTPLPIPAGDERNKAADKNDNDYYRKAEADISATARGAMPDTHSNELSKDLSSQNNNAANNGGFKSNASNNVSGQVTTADDKPVAYAQVNISANDKPVYTDAKGNFTLPAKDSAVNGTVTSAGYAPQKFTLQNSAAPSKIVLQQNDIAAKEISIGKKKAINKDSVKQEAGNEEMDEEEEEDAAPYGGWAEYDNYLHNNLKFPNEAKEKNIHGEVELLLKLKSNGDISLVKVGKTLCAECDAEAVRLVKEGPKWEVKNNKAVNAKVKIKF